jgi:hypothetical protein
MRIRNEFVERKPEVIFGEHAQKIDLAFTKRGAPGGLDLSGAPSVDQAVHAFRARQQYAAFLEGLADRRNAKAHGALV